MRINIIKKKSYIKIFSLITVSVIMCTILMANFLCLNKVQAVSIPKSEIKYDENDNSSVFPESYKEYIKKLKEEHPNWIIKAFYTNLDWDTVITSESSGTYSRVQDSAYGDAFKRLESVNDANYNASGFVLASKAAVAYTMDPRNFLNDKSIFQFRVIDENINSDTKAAVNEAMTYTPMKDTDYAEIIQNVGVSKKVSPLFIIARIKQETGCDIVNNGSINGKNSKYPGYYNFFNIGAVDSASNSVQYGIDLAYSNGWNTPEKAISGGVDWIYNHYIKYGQNTVYFQKFDVANPYGNATTILSMQYMSNISAPESEAQIAYTGALNAGTLDNAYTFYIPIYDNMPSTAAVYPGNSTNDYIDDNTVFCVSDKVSPDKLNVRFGPGTSYDIVASLSVGEKMTRIKKSQSSQWDLVKLENGQTGYVFREYIEEYIMVNSITLDKSEITLNVGDTYTLSCSVTPNNAVNKNIEWISSNKEIVTVDNGKITAKSGGTAIVTAKATETGKTATCTINVTAHVESISLEKESYKVVKDGYLKITPIIKPEAATNKEYTITSSNESIIAIDGNKIKGVSVGSANITFTTVDNKKSVTVKVEVIDLSKDESLNFDETLKVENSSVLGAPIKTTVKEFKEKITYGKQYSISILNKDGKELKDTDLVTTATTINLIYEDNIIQTFEMVIYGDVNGDGKMTAGDYVKIRNHIMESSKLDGIYLSAADYDANGKITAGDYVKVRNAIMSN